MSSARNAGESAICRLRAQPSAEIVRVECAKCRRECDLPAARATLCGDRACRVREMQARVRCAGCPRNPLRRSCVSSARTWRCVSIKKSGKWKCAFIVYTLQMFHFDYKCAKDKTIRTCKGSDDSLSLVGRFVACVHAGGADARLQSSCFGISWAGRFDSHDGVCARMASVIHGSCLLMNRGTMVSLAHS